VPWFKMKPQEPEPDPEAVADDTPAALDGEWSGSGLMFFKEDGGVLSSAKVASEAKIAIKEIRLRKKEFQLLKKDVSADMAELRAERRLKVARQGSMTRGGGNWGKLARSLERSNRDSARARHAAQLSPLEQKKAIIDERMAILDSAILHLERIALNNPDPAKAKAQTPKTHICPACSTSIDGDGRFCAACGASVGEQ
jgi:hypothetical protein